MSSEDKQLRKKFRLRLIDLLGMTGGALQANRLRSALTILGISIGVFSVVSVMTALGAMKEKINTGVSSFGSDGFRISNKKKAESSIRFREASKFKSMIDEHARAVTLISQKRKKIRFGETQSKRRTDIIGTNENYLITEALDLSYGRMLSNSNVVLSDPVAIIGSDLEEELFASVNPIGQFIRVGESRFQVIGVMAARGKIFGHSQDNFVIVPITTLSKRFGVGWDGIQISVKAKTQEELWGLEDLAYGMMRQVRGLQPEDANDFELRTNDSILEDLEEMMQAVGTGSLIISSIALLTAGVGILNIMLVSVTERTREIGLRMSLGAKRSDILWQFLIEAVVLSEIGCVVGVVLGIGTGDALAHYLEVPMILPWFWVWFALAVCSVIGVIFGFYPAWKAARLNPVEALRFA